MEKYPEEMIKFYTSSETHIIDRKHKLFCKFLFLSLLRNTSDHYELFPV